MCRRLPSLRPLFFFSACSQSIFELDSSKFWRFCHLRTMGSTLCEKGAGRYPERRHLCVTVFVLPVSAN